MDYLKNLFTSTIKKEKTLISFDYSLDLNDTIAGRPVVSARMYEEELPAILKSTPNKLNYDFSCKGPMWGKKCI